MAELIIDSNYYNKLDIEGFSKMMSSPSYCYKFYWLEAIVQLISANRTEATYDEIINKERLDVFAEFLRSNYAAETPFAMDARRTCTLLHDFYDQGFAFKITEECFEDDETFRIINDHTIEIDAKKCMRSLDDYDEDKFYFS